MRCGGGQPRCKTCEVYGNECRYDKTPPMSQIMAMARRLQEAEDTITNLQTQHTASSYGNPSSQAASTPRASPANHRLSPTVAQVEEPPPTLPLSDHPSNLPVAYSRPSKHHLPNISVDENGDIQYYGPTSAVHDPPQLQLPSPDSHICSATSGSLSTTTVHAHDQESKIWEDFSIGNASLQTGIPRQIMAKLLHLHWTWVSPMFMYVYRPGDLTRSCIKTEQFD